MREVGQGVTGRGNGEGLSAPSPGETQEKGCPGPLERVVLAVRKPLNLARSGLRLSLEDSLEKGRETKVPKCLKEKERLICFVGQNQ